MSFLPIKKKTSEKSKILKWDTLNAKTDFILKFPNFFRHFRHHKELPRTWLE